MIKIDKNAFKDTCRKLMQISGHGGNGPVHVGGNSLLCFTSFGDPLVIDSHDFMSLKLSFLPASQEISTMAFLYHFLSSGMRCIDMGAGCGYYAVAMARLVEKKGQVLSFEKEPQRFAKLQRNADFAHGTIDCENDEVELDAYIIDKPQNYQLVHLSPSVNLVQHIRGMTKTLQESPLLKILCHICPKNLQEHEEDYQSIFQTLTEMGFQGYLISALHLVTSEEQLLADSSSKTILLSRQGILHD